MREFRGARELSMSTLSLSAPWTRRSDTGLSKFGRRRRLQALLERELPGGLLETSVQIRTGI